MMDPDGRSALVQSCFFSLATGPVLDIDPATLGERVRIDDFDVPEREGPHGPVVQDQADAVWRNLESRRYIPQVPTANEIQENHAPLRAVRRLLCERWNLRRKGNDVLANCPAQESTPRIDGCMETCLSKEFRGVPLLIQHKVHKEV
jgi:hypothetical protein